jgi:hypothetical protein
MNCLTIKCSDIPQKVWECLHSAMASFEHVRKYICRFFNLTFSHYSYVHRGDQSGGSGLVSRDRVQQICNTLNSERVRGVFFNAQTVENHVGGGTCSAMAIDFINEYLQTKAQKPSSPSKIIEKISQRYTHSSKEFMHNQAAFNTIEKNSREYTTDFKKDKIAAMLKLYHRNVGYCSEEVDLSSHTADRKISQIISRLPKGIFLIRALHLAQNPKEELVGHSSVLINEDQGIFFYDPNHGTAELQQRNAGRITYDFLRQAYRQFNIPHVRLYRVS